MSLKSIYVRVLRVVRAALSSIGVLGAMERSRRPWVRHLRSLLAIHDTEDLAHLDLPWWTYAAIREVDDFLNGRPAKVFEYGSGASTVWLARRAEQVVSVEHHEQFARRVAELGAGFDNITLMTVVPEPATATSTATSGRRGYENMDFSNYVRSIERAGGTFDLIVIDGRARVACLDQAIAYLEPGGLILFDDLRRKRYRGVLERGDLDIEMLRGAKPSIPYRDTTARIRPAGA
jgi:hypothetical protein